MPCRACAACHGLYPYNNITSRIAPGDPLGPALPCLVLSRFLLFFPPSPPLSTHTNTPAQHRAADCDPTPIVREPAVKRVRPHYILPLRYRWTRASRRPRRTTQVGKPDLTTVSQQPDATHACIHPSTRYVLAPADQHPCCTPSHQLPRKQPLRDPGVLGHRHLPSTSADRRSWPSTTTAHTYIQHHASIHTDPRSSFKPNPEQSANSTPRTPAFSALVVI